MSRGNNLVEMLRLAEARLGVELAPEVELAESLAIQLRETELLLNLWKTVALEVADQRDALR